MCQVPEKKLIGLLQDSCGSASHLNVIKSVSFYSITQIT